MSRRAVTDDAQDMHGAGSHMVRPAPSVTAAPVLARCSDVHVPAVHQLAGTRDPPTPAALALGIAAGRCWAAYGDGPPRNWRSA